MRRFPPERIVCLTEETVETLYLLGEENRIVGVSGYAVRPPRIRREKPRVSVFTSADIPKILVLEPDLVLAFSDLQAGIVQDLARAGLAVHLFNQRDVAGILAMIRALGALIDAAMPPTRWRTPWLGASRRSRASSSIEAPDRASSLRSGTSR
jgi:iron complex transport system substrate-binding protein